MVHTILGLPGESHTDVLDTIAYLNRFPIDGIKMQLMHILEHTDLAQWYRKGEYIPMEQMEYIDLVCDCIAHLRNDIVIHRLTGDGDKEILLAPKWSMNKRHVLNALHHRLKVREIFQGCSLS